MGYSLGDDKKSFDVFNTTISIHNKICEELKNNNWIYDDKSYSFKKDNRNLKIEVVQDHITSLYFYDDLVDWEKFINKNYEFEAVYGDDKIDCVSTYVSDSTNIKKIVNKLETAPLFEKEKTKYDKWILPVDVICYNELTTYETRIQAKNFYSRCMCCSEGSEHERYSNIFFSLDQTNDKMVHDGECEYYEEPTIFRVGKFVKDHNETVEKLPNPMKYSQYLEYKKNKDMEVHL